jgi:hypothetical protein
MLQAFSFRRSPPSLTGVVAWRDRPTADRTHDMNSMNSSGGTQLTTAHGEEIMNRIVAATVATLLALAPAVLAQEDTNRTGQTMDQSGPKGDTSPSVGSKEPGGAGNAAGQDGLPSRNPSSHDRSDNSDSGGAKPSAKD